MSYLWGSHERRAKRRYAELCAVTVVSAAVLASGVRPAFAVSDAPKGDKLVFRDAGAKSHSEVLAIAALYLRTADAVDPNCAAAKRLIKNLGSIHLQGVPQRLITAAKFIATYWPKILKVDSSCDVARKFRFSAIGLLGSAKYLYPECRPVDNLSCFFTFWLETTVHREDRTWPLPDVCHWRLAGSMTSSSIVIHYKPSKRGCMSS